MSCVIGLVTDDSVIMVADSSVCDGNVITPGGFEKISVFDTALGEMAIGFVGAMLPGQLIHFFFRPPEVPQSITCDGDTDKYVVTIVIPAIKRILVERGDWKNQEDYITGLIAIDGALYFVDNNLSVSKSTLGYDAIGSGREIALGSLHTTAAIFELDGDYDTMVDLAMQAADDLTIYVSGRRQRVEV